MTELQTGLNIIFNNALMWWNYYMSDSVPLVVKMIFLAPLVFLLVGLVRAVFGGNLSGKTDL